MYKFGFSSEYILGLTIPQIRILLYNLFKILKAEAGSSEKSDNSNKYDADKNIANRTAFAATLKMLKEKTGRNEFTLEEIQNPAQTIKKSVK
jgi:hypothetical protein